MTIEKQVLELCEIIRDAYTGGGKTWEAAADGMNQRAERLIKLLTKKPKKKK